MQVTHGKSSRSLVHPTAVIDPKAEIGEGCRIGPYCVIGEGVVLGPGCALHSHVVIEGWTRMGSNNEVFPFCAIGLRTQDLKWKGGTTRTEIGDGNTFREHVTVHSATGDGETTVIGRLCSPGAARYPQRLLLLQARFR